MMTTLYQTHMLFRVKLYVAIVSGQSDGEGSCGGLFKDKYYYEA
jgi:hypothetical protein